MALEANPIVCYVTDSASLPGGVVRLSDAISRAVERGANWVQIREKDVAAQELLAIVQKAVQRVRGVGGKVIVNDRLDVAIAAGAHGVHLGGASLPVAAVTEWRRRNGVAGFLIGASCHSLGEAVAAERDGADYIFFGPVFATPSKAAYGPPQGVERLWEVARAVKIPVIAIGGITQENSAECLRENVRGYAAIGWFQK